MIENGSKNLLQKKIVSSCASDTTRSLQYPYTKYGTGLKCNESLKKRGSLSLWISEDAIKKWKAAKDPRFIGAPKKYSDDAILCSMTLKVVYYLLYRQLIGFLACLFGLMGTELSIPHFTTQPKSSSSKKILYNAIVVYFTYPRTVPDIFAIFLSIKFTAWIWTAKPGS